MPATLSRAVMTDLLRGELGFEGVSITDALDMAGVGRGPDGILDVVAAIEAGVDQQLTAADTQARGRIEGALVYAAAKGLFHRDGWAVEQRLAALREWLASFGPPPDIDVVGSAEHLALAGELAARSITLVRDPGGLLPGPWSEVGRVLAVMPRPTDLTLPTPRRRSRQGLAAALRRYHGDVDQVVVEPELDARRTRSARGPRVRTSPWSGPSTVIDFCSQLKLVEAVVATARRRSPWRCAGLGTCRRIRRA